MKKFIIILQSLSVLIFISCFVNCGSSVKITRQYYSPGPLPDVNTSGLNGKVILLDPGHGGTMSGAVGKGGLMEKDVNLKVALFLRDMLLKGGARVYMTRDTDRDFLPEPGAHVKMDLMRRSEISDSIQPDLFLSIHHNAKDASDTLPDTTKAFYKMGDIGPSLDAAIKIEKYFTIMLGMPQNALSFGNYSVLRNTHAPAVLGEPSFISNPEVEAVLRDDNKLKVEADAYFRGIAESFGNGVPRVLYLDYDSNTSVLDAYINSDFDLDSSSGECTLDGKAIPLYIEGKRVYSPINSTLGNGRHVARMRVVNARGNSSIVKEATFIINREPALMNAYYDMNPSRAGQIVPVKILVSDAEGMPVIDGTLVTTNGDEKTVTLNGRCIIYPVFKKQSKIIITCGNASCELAFKLQSGIPEPVQGFVECDKRAVPAFLTCFPGGMGVTCDINGFFQCPDSIRQAHVYSSGYVDTLVDLEKLKVNHVSLRKVENGILFCRRIVIDPEFGGLESGGSGKEGERASDINMRVACAAMGRLKSAGADVILARQGDRSVYVSDRVDAANEPLAEIYILVRTDSGSSKPYVATYPNSQFGGILSQGMIKASSKLFSPERRESINYITQQTPCTSVIVSLTPLKSEKPIDAEVINKAAECIYNGALYYFKNLPKK